MLQKLRIYVLHDIQRVSDPEPTQQQYSKPGLARITFSENVQKSRERERWKKVKYIPLRIRIGDHRRVRVLTEV